MPSWIEFPISTDVTQIKTEVYERLEEVFPGWQRDIETSAENFLIEGFANLIADLKILASEVPPEIFRQFGIQIMGQTPTAAVGATALATVTAKDNAGYTLIAGTEVALAKAGDEPIAFSVVYDVTIPPGKVVSEAGEVLLRAVPAGTIGNNLSNPPELITSTKVEWIQDIVLVAETGGGEDEETGNEFLNKLREKMQQISPKLITERDFMIQARNTPGIFRGLAIANYNAETAKEEEGNTLTMWLATQVGGKVSAEAKALLEAAILENRMPNFKIFLRDAAYVLFDTEAEGRALPGYDPAVVKANVEVAIKDFFSPAKFALDPVTNDLTTWIPKNTLRWSELIAKINTVPGFDFITLLKFGEHGKALGSADIVMAGKVALPEPKELKVTILPAE